MEKRAVLAFALSALLLFLYVWVQEQYFTPSRPPETTSGKPPTSPATPQAPKPAAPPADSSRDKAAQPAPLAARPAEAGPRPREPQRTATISAPLYRAVVSSEGGKLLDWTLHYRGEKPMVIVGDLGPTGLVVTPGGARSGPPLAMKLSPEALTLNAERPNGEIVLTGDADGLVVRETLRFHASDYAFDVVVRVENSGATARTVSVALPWATRPHWGDVGEKFIGQYPNEIVWSARGDTMRAEDLHAIPPLETEGEWIASGSVWYLAAFVPRTPGWILAARGEGAPDPKNPGKNPAGRVIVETRAAPTIAAGQAWEGTVTVYVGPKEYERLSALGLERTLNFGGFPLPRRWGGLPMDWLGVPILLVMKWVYRYVGNYGIAIILLTVVTRVLFYPLTVKSMRSMKAMQALSPQVNALRAKYKNDPQRLQRETMELYRQQKVNPLGGCLPMVAQIPIFYALYLALSVSVELQNAAFLCIGRVPSWVPGLGGSDVWICDLASQDPTYVLPILMGVTMFVQQKMTPTMGDPRQAKMMLMMPFVFTFMFLNLPSGLVLYWTVSNILQIVQQWHMNRPQAQPAREVKNASRA